MPRKARLDIPYLVHHVMARGIEGCDIFRNDSDRYSFLRRLSDIITDVGGVSLFAWALMPTHFHLLIRLEGDVRLSTLMQRLMTGYAVNFNKFHKRKGHLFQNRYKSIVVEEEPYFLELVRYIHLNPVRARILSSVSQLDKYKFTGHAVLLGKREYIVQNTDEVLMRFSKERKSAMARYQEFVTAGFDQGVREDLRGGGLIRSCGGISAILTRSFDEREAADDRILGLGDFVESVLKSHEEQGLPRGSSVEEVLAEVANSSNIPKELILGPNRDRKTSKARREFYLQALEEAGATVAFLARKTGRAHVSVALAIDVAKRERAERNCHSEGK